MTHYAVESELKVPDGFFGLLAQGWDITDFGVPEKRALMPLEALWVEHVVGVIWREYVTSDASSYEDFAAAVNATISSLSENLNRHAKRGGPRPDYSDEERSILERTVSEADRASALRRIGELAAVWAQTPRGGTMELEFRVD
jgi:hypothetical protein